LFCLSIFRFLDFRLLRLEDGATANNLIEMLMGSLELKGGLDKNGIASKLLCFGANGCSAFQGSKNGVTVQIQKIFSPFTSGVHCHAHKINLVEKTLSQLDIFHYIEELMRLSHAYFVHSSKKFNEYDTKGQNLLKNMTTR
jgi:hypothetical protein